jgi:hypothetical protein
MLPSEENRRAENYVKYIAGSDRSVNFTHRTENLSEDSK